MVRYFAARKLALRHSTTLDGKALHMYSTILYSKLRNFRVQYTMAVKVRYCTMARYSMALSGKVWYCPVRYGTVR